MMNLFIFTNMALLLFGFSGADEQGPCDYYWDVCDINADCTPYLDYWYTCKCKPNYAGNGRYCRWQSTLPEPCASNLCHANAYCRNVGDSYFCSCKEGYVGDGKNCTSTSPEPCDSKPCHANATCTNLGLSYSCVCKPGYVGDGQICIDLVTIGEPFCPSSYANWTSWFDRDDPTETGDYETLQELRKENSADICKNPISAHAQLATGLPYQYSGEKVTVNRKEGFYCVNSDQQDKECLDYRVRFCCEREPLCPSNTHRWTEWFDRDNPSEKGDYEVLSHLRAENPGKICCSPENVHAQLVTGEPYQFANEVVTINRKEGFYCVNSDQNEKKCHDYRVRFCCPQRVVLGCQIDG